MIFFKSTKKILKNKNNPFKHLQNTSIRTTNNITIRKFSIHPKTYSSYYIFCSSIYNYIYLQIACTANMPPITCILECILFYSQAFLFTTACVHNSIFFNEVKNLFLYGKQKYPIIKRTFNIIIYQSNSSNKKERI